MGYAAICYVECVYYPALTAIGVPLNLLAVVILCRGKCGLSKCITRYLVAMATADLMGVIIGVAFERINNIYIFAKFLFIAPICATLVVFRLAAMDCSVWLTVAFTFDRFNLTAIVILCRGKCGLSKCITRYLVAMATADLMGVIIGVALERINNIYVFATYLLITPICATLLVFRLAAMECSVWLTVVFTFDRCIAICSQKLRKRYCTARAATTVVVIVCIGSCLRCVPFYFSVDAFAIIDNVPWRCIGRADYFTLPVWKAYQVFNSIITPSLPIGLIILFNALTVSHIIAANRVRRGLRSSNDNKKDSEVENRRKSMILLFALSANFILLWIPFIVSAMFWQAQNYFYTDRYLNSPSFILQEFGFMLQFLCTCTNTCIYTLSQRKFREEMKKGVKHLVTLSGRLCR
ncbi:probable G-protein coupled receptor 139 [Mobula hypostoma]|uniref:probable G-protein coupled receptor 139 n=1 Tax=Mobula hypostoma TaxID=723540 RepID=UPI002FC2E172